MTKKKGIHANTRSGLRPLKKGEQITYYGGGFHIVKKKKRKGKVSEDTRQRRKYARGGRIEAYTMGETQKKRKDPIWR